MPMAQRRQREVPRDGGTDVGKAAALADRLALPAADQEDWHLFAGVISSLPGRITAMISCDHQQVVRLQSRQEFGQAAVEGFQCGGISGHVTTMTIDAIEVDEIGKQQSAVAKFIPASNRAVEQGVVTVASFVKASAAMCENVVDLADRDDVPGLRDRNVKDGIFGRRHRKVVPVGGALEICRRGADERARDHAADVERVDEAPRDTAHLVQSPEPERLFMSCDLKDAVRGGIANRLAGFHMYRTELADDLGPGSVAIAENPGQFRLSAKCIDKRWRKRRFCFWEVSPVEPDRHARDFPMAGGGILASRLLAGATETTEQCGPIVQTGRIASGGEMAGLPEAKRGEVGQPQQPLTMRVVRLPARASLGDMADRIGAFVAIARRVRCRADPDRIHDEDHGAHSAILSEASTREVAWDRSQ